MLMSLLDAAFESPRRAMRKTTPRIASLNLFWLFAYAPTFPRSRTFFSLFFSELLISNLRFVD